MALILHCADISHPGKPWPIHEIWTHALMEEFFKQGETEKGLGLPCSPLCDRENTLVAESQIGRSAPVFSHHCRTDSSLSSKASFNTLLNLRLLSWVICWTKC